MGMTNPGGTAPASMIMTSSFDDSNNTSPAGFYNFYWSGGYGGSFLEKSKNSQFSGAQLVYVNSGGTLTVNPAFHLYHLIYITAPIYSYTIDLSAVSIGADDNPIDIVFLFGDDANTEKSNLITLLSWTGTSSIINSGSLPLTAKIGQSIWLRFYNDGTGLIVSQTY